MTQTQRPGPKTALRTEMITFVGLGVFFTIVAVIYITVAEAEPIGSTVFILLACMAYMIGGYLWLLGRRVPIENRWEDRLDAEIAESTGEVGVFAPSSWWPLVVGAGVALVFLALAIGWWIMVPAVIVAAIGLIGLIMEFSTGKHAH